MNHTTLRGIFPEPKPVPRRNFLKENVQHIKQMQKQSSTGPTAKPRNILTKKSKPTTINSTNSGVINKTSNMRGSGSLKSLTNRSCQTEVFDDLDELYATGTVRYASAAPATRTSMPARRGLRRNPPISSSTLDHGDSSSATFNNRLKKLSLADDDDSEKPVNFVQDNINNSSNKQTVTSSELSPVAAIPPPTYQRGVLPKYLKDKRALEQQNEDKALLEIEYPGHILLPDNERKEYLRVSRQSYADLIKELNAMPVRSDTLRMRKRKMEVEDELKKIEEAIKVFQKPKVFVKAD